MTHGFDWIAPYYDSLARLVFGDSIKRCQLQYLGQIPPGSNVLMLGGGTGWLLGELLKANPTCRVWYVEASLRMLRQAEKLCANQLAHQVLFIHGTERSLEQYGNVRFDSVITNFYFDLFPPRYLGEVLGSITRSMNRGSHLLVSEFVSNRWWQRIMLFVMYRFFRATCSIEATYLPEWQGELRKFQFVECDTKPFFHGFIKSSLYQFAGSGG
jgi:ubiquinone/menaquinone biosynthesis C-methylase UbiE